MRCLRVRQVQSEVHLCFGYDVVAWHRESQLMKTVDRCHIRQRDLAGVMGNHHALASQRSFLLLSACSLLPPGCPKLPHRQPQVKLLGITHKWRPKGIRGTIDVGAIQHLQVNCCLPNLQVHRFSIPALPAQLISPWRIQVHHCNTR